MSVLTESLDELSDLVVPLFAGVTNKNVTVPEWPEPPFGPDQLKVGVVCGRRVGGHRVEHMIVGREHKRLSSPTAISQSW